MEMPVLRSRGAPLAAIVAFALAATAHGDFVERPVERKWTNTAGKSLVATLAGTDAEERTVTLRLPSGDLHVIPLAELSPVDREYIARLGKASAPPSANAGWDAPWPKAAKAAPGEIEIVLEDAKKNHYVYRSNHFEFHSDIRISRSVVNEFSRLFEATWAALAALPFDHRLKPPRKATHFVTRLFRSTAGYAQAGGPPGSGGVFRGKTGDVLIPLRSLGVRVVGRRVILDRDGSNETLIHELVHQISMQDQLGALAWYREGSAEYLSTLPYRSGRFSFTNPARIALRSMGEPNEMTFPPLEKFLSYNRLQFYGASSGVSREGAMNYRRALLMTTYFFHLDGDGDAARMKNYLAALRKRTAHRAAIAHLLDGRSFAELEEAFSKAWRSKGLRIHFQGG